MLPLPYRKYSQETWERSRMPSRDEYGISGALHL